MANFTVWYDPSESDHGYHKVWCIEGSIGLGFWVARADAVRRVEETVNDPSNPLGLAKMAKFDGLIDHGGFDTATEAIAYIKMQELME
ncbi:hypothetical protein NVP1026O_064 [Vibrio phage 1.026.O._10N.222.49.C7]|uniref:Uncharacterized protein n=1 Tax=Vibrio phage 1.026.O._10N.222.49.C7 TaxID=1881421 RepID=A0A2I7QMM2_9CAUD|nr:hypothetical protein HYP57_gp064 [Vibrio phage 1.026.O._10N.222.49.C7]AUR82655.1 hypothetical protein NVP1026O_064 [Vibrio phage 1.026.O._10N.222.49.C7]